MRKKGFFYLKNILILAFLILLILSIPPVFAFELNQSLTYDGNGNLITGDGKYREYNEFNQLIRVYNGSINDSDEILEEYVYHPTEDRILISFPNHGSIEPREAVVYVNKNIERIYDNLSGAPHVNYTYYVFDETGIVGEITKNISYYEEGSPYYSGPPTVLKNLSYHNDYSGSVSLITNDSGLIVEETFYEPFGGILIGGNTSRYSYEGKEFDSLTEDYDFHFRKYDPSLMIFTQPDSVVVNVYDPQTLNRYAFERDNPYKYVDEDGKIAVYYGGQISGGVGVGGSIFAGKYFSYNILEGLNQGLFYQTGIGASTPSSSFAGVFGISPFGDLNDFKGNSISGGFDIGDLFTAGLGISFPVDNSGNLKLSKFSIQITAAPFTDLNLPVPFSAYLSKSNTKIFKFKSINFLNLAYIAILSINANNRNTNSINNIQTSSNIDLAQESFISDSRQTSDKPNSIVNNIIFKPKKDPFYCKNHSDQEC